MQNARREASSRPLSLVMQAFATGTSRSPRFRPARSPVSVLVIINASVPAFLAEARFSGESFRLWTRARPRGASAQLPRVDPHARQSREGGEALRDRAARAGRYRALFRSSSTRTACSPCAGYAPGSPSASSRCSRSTACTRSWRDARRAATSRLATSRSTSPSSARDRAPCRRSSPSGRHVRGRAVHVEPVRLPAHPHRRRGAARPSSAQPTPRPPGRDRAPQRLVPLPRQDGLGLCATSPSRSRRATLGLVGENGAGKSTPRQAAHAAYDPTEGEIRFGAWTCATWTPPTCAGASARCSRTSSGTSSRPPRTSASATPPSSRTAPAFRGARRGEAPRRLLESCRRATTRSSAAGSRRGTRSCPGSGRSSRSRARLREDAEVLVLDEPTAAIDAEAEHELFQHFKELAADRTAIVIPHRFSTVRIADRIAVLHGGQLGGVRHPPRARGARRALRPALPARRRRATSISGARGAVRRLEARPRGACGRNALRSDGDARS